MGKLTTKVIQAADWKSCADDMVTAAAEGRIILFPTETVYGIGSAVSEANINRMMDMKHRPPGKPFQILISDKAQLQRWGARINPQSQRLIDTYWPGPMTLVLEVDPVAAAPGIAPTGTIGFRMPAHEISSELVALCGGSLAATSANISGMKDSRTCMEAVLAFENGIAIAIDAGPLKNPVPSTVVAVRNGVAVVLRPGVIKEDDIVKTAG